MAKKPKRITDEPNEARAPITLRNAILWSGFVVLVVASIFTVMIPELTDDGAEDEADAQGQSSDSDDSDEQRAGDDDSGDSPSSAPAAPSGSAAPSPAP